MKYYDFRFRDFKSIKTRQGFSLLLETPIFIEIWHPSFFATRLAKYCPFERAEIESNKDCKKRQGLFATFGDPAEVPPPESPEVPPQNDKDFQYI